MAIRSLDLTIISAKGLQKFKILGKMHFYAVVYISGAGNQDQKYATHVDKCSDSNPTWNVSMHFKIDESAALSNRLTLVVKIKSQTILGDRDRGEVCVPIKELLEGSSSSSPGQPLQLKVRKPSGKLKGELNISYKIGDKTAGTGRVEEPVTANSAEASASSSPYLPTGAAPVASAAVYPPLAVTTGAYPPSREGGGGCDAGLAQPQTPVDITNKTAQMRVINDLLALGKQIAQGNNGTLVYEGTYRDETVAVKRLVKCLHDDSLEIKVLSSLEKNHPNVIRFYGKEEDDNFIYLVMELCDFTLSDLVNTIKHPKLWSSSTDYPTTDMSELMRGIVAGLVHLHSLGFFHTNLRPSNVLMAGLCPKLSGFGSCIESFDDIGSEMPSVVAELVWNCGKCPLLSLRSHMDMVRKRP